MLEGHFPLFCVSRVRTGRILNFSTQADEETLQLNVNQVDEDWMSAAEKLTLGRSAEEKEVRHAI